MGVQGCEGPGTGWFKHWIWLQHMLWFLSWPVQSCGCWVWRAHMPWWHPLSWWCRCVVFYMDNVAVVHSMSHSHIYMYESQSYTIYTCARLGRRGWVWPCKSLLACGESCCGESICRDGTLIPGRSGQFVWVVKSCSVLCFFNCGQEHDARQRVAPAAVLLMQTAQPLGPSGSPLYSLWCSLIL